MNRNATTDPQNNRAFAREVVAILGVVREDAGYLDYLERASLANRECHDPQAAASSILSESGFLGDEQ